MSSPAETNPPEHQREGRGEQKGSAPARLTVCVRATQAVWVGYSRDKYVTKLFLKVYSFQC